MVRIKRCRGQDRVERQKGKLSLSDLDTEHLEPPFKPFWADRPSANVKAETKVQGNVWHEPPSIPGPALPATSTELRTSTSLPLLSRFTFDDTFSLSSIRSVPITASPQPTAMASTTEPKTLYFAYGTDISISIMQRTYPGTDFISAAKLPSFKWLIGSTNFPIITASLEDHVYGILYSVPTIHIPFLSARVLKRASAIPVSLLVHLHVDNTKTPENPGWGFACMGPNVPGERTALVFIAAGDEKEGVVAEGEEGEDFVQRMNRGIVEATMQGFPDEWTSRVLRKWIPLPKSPTGIYW
jgi:gamma-glutamylcyclotransferase